MDSTFTLIHPIDPTVEELISAELLRPGMVVLLLGQAIGRINSWRDETIITRWCTVTDDIRRAYRDYGPVMSFAGLYDDGTSHIRSCDVGESWVVKKTSMPQRG